MEEEGPRGRLPAGHPSCVRQQQACRRSNALGSAAMDSCSELNKGQHDRLCVGRCNRALKSTTMDKRSLHVWEQAPISGQDWQPCTRTLVPPSSKTAGAAVHWVQRGHAATHYAHWQYASTTLRSVSMPCTSVVAAASPGSECFAASAHARLHCPTLQKEALKASSREPAHSRLRLAHLPGTRRPAPWLSGSWGT